MGRQDAASEQAAEPERPASVHVIHVAPKVAVRAAPRGHVQVLPRHAEFVAGPGHRLHVRLVLARLMAPVKGGMGRHVDDEQPDASFPGDPGHAAEGVIRPAQDDEIAQKVVAGGLEACGSQAFPLLLRWPARKVFDTLAQSRRTVT